MKWNTGTKLTTYGQKNNFFPGGFVGWICRLFKILYSGGWKLYAYFDGSTKIKLVQKYKYSGNVDAPWFFSVSENRWRYIRSKLVKSLLVDSMLHHSDSSKELTKLDISFPTQWLNNGTLDARTDVNTTFTEMGSWTSSIGGGATIYTVSSLASYRISLTG